MGYYSWRQEATFPLGSRKSQEGGKDTKSPLPSETEPRVHSVNAQTKPEVT